MKVVWLSYLFLFIVGAAANMIFGFNPIVTNALFAIHASLILFCIPSLKHWSNTEKTILFIGFALRVSGLLYDVFFDTPFLYLNFSTDAEGFYASALIYARDISLIWTEDLYGGVYTKFLGVLFYLQGPSRLWIQYLSTICGLSVILMLKKILMSVNASAKTQLLIITISSLFPMSVMQSSTIVREMQPTFLVTCSIYFFIRWLKDGRLKYAASTVACLLGASFFHAGVLGLAIGYTFGFVFYRNRAKRFSFNYKSVVIMLICIVLAAFVVNVFSNVLMQHLFHDGELRDVFALASREGRGGAGYDVGIRVDTPAGLVFGGMLRLVYFLGSPMPWQWRGLSDIGVFIIDASMYLLTLFFLVKNRRSLFDGSEKSKWIALILLCVLGASFVFGIGVSNAGQAMRHRQKLIPVFLTLLALAIEKKKEKRYVEAVMDIPNKAESISSAK